MVYTLQRLSWMLGKISGKFDSCNIFRHIRVAQARSSIYGAQSRQIIGEKTWRYGVNQ